MRFDVIVVGAGALGLASAAEMRQRGRHVAVLAPDETCASALAAGMLAPAFESVLDPGAGRHAGLMRRARDLWPAFAKATGVELIRDGAEWRGTDAEGMERRLIEAGFAVERTPFGVMTPDDWRLDPGLALAALDCGLERIVARLVSLDEDGAGFALKTDAGETLRARQVVLATGWHPPQCGVSLPPIRPIRGQAVRVGGQSPDRVLRGVGVYVAPAGGGAIIGATMDEGRSDTEPDAEVTEALLRRAAGIWPDAKRAQLIAAFAGVRGASADGLPFAGTIRPNLAVALGPRRNGWLLAPMVAAVVADALEGEIGPGPFDPGRKL